MEKNTLFDVAEIVRRAKQVMHFSTDSELALYLGVSRSTLSNWIARNSIDFPLILSKLKHIDYNWLLLGKGNLASVNKTNRDGAAVADEQASKERTVMLYDVTVANNLKTLFANKKQYAVGRISIPSIPACDGAVHISGDSMYPILKSGDIVGFKEVSSFDNLIYGEMYLVSFTIDGDEYLTVKYVNRSSIEGCIKLVSYNSHHEPMDIAFTSIQAMALVKFTIRKNVMM